MTNQKRKQVVLLLTVGLPVFIFCLFVWAGTNLFGVTLANVRLGQTIFPFLLSYGLPTTTVSEAATLVFTNHMTGEVISLTTNSSCTLWIWCPSVHVVSITLFPPKNKSWDIPTARATCKKFTPPDSQFMVTIPPKDILKGDDLRDIYISKTLAHTFTTEYFRDENGMTTEPGIYKLALRFGYDINSPTPIAMCWLALGKSVN